LPAPAGPPIMGAVSATDAPLPDDVAEWIRRGREALAARRYAEAADWFDRALDRCPEHPQVQALAVTAEFWRRLARTGDGFAPVEPPVPIRPATKPG
jgi:hypothetical protein